MMNNRDVAPSGRAVWLIRLGAIAWFVGGLAFLLGLGVLLPLSPWIVAGLALLALVIAAPLAWMVGKWSRHGRPFWRGWGKTALGLAFLLVFLAASPLLGFALVTQFRPALVPQVTLTNGQKTVVFQGMQHVAADSFYRSVIYDLEDALSKNYVLYYEGVKFDDPAANRWLNNMLFGDKDITSSYGDLGKICGLKQQGDYFALLGPDIAAHPGRHVVADVSTRDMLAEYQRLMKSDPAFVRAMKARKPPNADGGGSADRLMAFFSKATPAQRDAGGIACRGFMSWAANKTSKTSEGDPLDRVVLDFRNRQLARRLLAEPNPRIFLTYGANHLPGLLADLRSADPRWHVASKRWLRTVEEPEEFDRPLDL